MERRVTKSFEIDGVLLVSVKDYDVDYCIKNKEVFHILYEDEKMTMDPHSLINKEIMRSKPQKSKHGTADYCLVSYRWEPNLVPND